MPAQGWRSFIGIPFWQGNRNWLFLGVAGVVPHATRGAFPLLHGYRHFFEAPPLEGLTALSAALTATSDEYHQHRSSYGVHSADSRSPEEHVEVEAWIVLRASQAYARTEQLMFRTLLLSQEDLNNVPPFARRYGASGAAENSAVVTGEKPVKIAPKLFLAATAPSIKASFSTAAWARLQVSRVVFETRPSPK